jgi:WD40 repeat protein
MQMQAIYDFCTMKSFEIGVPCHLTARWNLGKGARKWISNIKNSKVSDCLKKKNFNILISQADEFVQWLSKCYFQFDGVHIVSGSLDTSIRVWDVESGNCLHTLVGHQSLTSGMELKDNILVSGNADSTVKVWDITTGQCLQTLQGMYDDRNSCAWKAWNNLRN